MMEPKKLIPGQSVIINTVVSPETHKKLIHLRTAIAYKQETHYTLAEIYQLAIEAGVKTLESKIESIAA